MNRELPANTVVGAPSNVINNIARIVRQTTPITANQHRDLENLVSLLISESVEVE